MVFTEIDNNYEGGVPVGADIVVVEMDDVLDGSFESALVLYGFDEIGDASLVGDMNNPVYGFLGDK